MPNEHAKTDQDHAPFEPERTEPDSARHSGVSSPGFCGGWFIWCRWWLVVIVPGGGGRVPRRLRARRGYASRWRSVAGWCPPSGPTRRWRARAVSMSCQGPWLRDQLGLVQRVECLGQGEAERRSPFDPTEATASQSARACP